MSEQPPQDEITPEPGGKPAKRPPEQPTQVRRMLWLVGLGLGLYLIGQGVWGLLTGGS